MVFNRKDTFFAGFMCAPQPQSWYDLISRGGGSVNEITVIAEDVSRNKEAEEFNILQFPSFQSEFMASREYRDEKEQNLM